MAYVIEVYYVIASDGTSLLIFFSERFQGKGNTIFDRTLSLKKFKPIVTNGLVSGFSVVGN